METESGAAVKSLTNEQMVNAMCYRLRDLRKEQKLSQEELSRRSGIDRVTISRTEKGRPASLMTLIQLLRGLSRLDLLTPFLGASPTVPDTAFSEVLEKPDAPKLKEPETKTEYPDW